MRTREATWRGALLLTATMLAWAFPAGAQATTTIGSDLSRDITSVCGPCTLVASTGDGSMPLRAPADGHVVSVSFKAFDTSDVRILVMRPSPSGPWWHVAESPPLTVAAPGLATFTVDLPIAAGDAVGIAANSVGAAENVPGFGVLGFPGIGESGFRLGFLSFPHELLLQATIDDSVAPTERVTITSGPDGLTNDATPTYAFESTEPKTFECRVEGTPFAACTSPFEPGQMSDGPHMFVVRGTDADGYRDAAWRQIVVDMTPPATTIDDRPPALANDATPTFDYHAGEPSTFACRLDGLPFTPCGPSTFTPGMDLSDGEHTFSVRATDTAGNVEASPPSLTFTVDTVPPVTTIASGPPQFTSDPTPRFEYHAGEPGSFACQVDAEAFAPCDPDAFTPASDLADGEHTFTVRATDGAGNLDPSPPSRTFTVDTVPPDTTVVGPAGGRTGAPLAFTLGASEAATFQCNVDAGAYVACTSPVVSALPDGSHSLRVRAVDRAHNVDATPALHTFKVGNAPPDTTIVAAPSGPTLVRAPSFAFVSSEPGSSFTCRLDLRPPTACTSPFSMGALAFGDHVFTVQASDALGRPDPSPAVRRFTVKRAQPGCPTVARQRVGTPRRDRLLGGRAAGEVLFGLAGDDELRGLRGRDCLYGGLGDDRLTGARGADRLFGGAGDDELRGENAAGDRLDREEAGQGDGGDRLDGGPGNDRLVDFRGSARLSGGPGTDRIDARDRSAVDRRTPDAIVCGPGADDVLADARDSVARDCEHITRVPVRRDG